MLIPELEHWDEELGAAHLRWRVALGAVSSYTELVDLIPHAHLNLVWRRLIATFCSPPATSLQLFLAESAV